jgi:hypothetical protein
MISHSPDCTSTCVKQRGRALETSHTGRARWHWYHASSVTTHADQTVPYRLPDSRVPLLHVATGETHSYNGEPTTLAFSQCHPKVLGRQPRRKEQENQSQSSCKRANVKWCCSYSSRGAPRELGREARVRQRSTHILRWVIDYGKNWSSCLCQVSA